MHKQPYRIGLCGAAVHTNSESGSTFSSKRDNFSHDPNIKTYINVDFNINLLDYNTSPPIEKFRVQCWHHGTRFKTADRFKTTVLGQVLLHVNYCL